ncbi:MAG: anhydro-N-acetylmuramic acid kinase [Bacteroidota bacterium]
MKTSRLVAGLMSGTSLDGIDAVLLRVRGSGPATRFRQLAFVTRPFPPGVRKMILRNSDPATANLDEIVRLNILLAELYAGAVRAVVRAGGKTMRDLDLIGSHGQTIRHLPKAVAMFGKRIRATLQIGDPSALAALTGVTTVGDFRVADMALGGQGAPLVPYFDWLVFRSPKRNRLLLNIGGIANVTVLPRAGRPDQVYAFDTGPGNMVVDSLMHEFYGKPYDEEGRTALRGDVSLELFSVLMRHPYLKTRPPKSTGREEFGEAFVNGLLRRAKGYDREDIIATASQFTAFAIYEGYKRFVFPVMAVDEVIVSGGGAKNRYFMDELGRYFDGSAVRPVEHFGITAEAKEAVCFAILANETMAGRATSLPGVTGASRSTVLGKICHGS